MLIISALYFCQSMVSKTDLVILSICAGVILIIIFIILLGAILRFLKPARTSKLAMRRAYGSMPVAVPDVSVSSHSSTLHASEGSHTPLRSVSDEQLLDHFLMMLRRDGIKLGILQRGNDSTSDESMEWNVVEAKLSLEDNGHILSWQSGTLDLRNVTAVRPGKLAAGSRTVALNNIENDVCFVLETPEGEDDMHLVTGSTLERSALKQGFDMLVRSLKDVASTQSNGNDIETGTSQERAPLLAVI